MRKKVYKYFFDFLKPQEKWLNEMSSRGYKLVSTTNLSYEFEDCNPCEYEYAVEFVGDKSYSKMKEYKKFLEEMGFRCFTKNVNINYSLGKIKFRPWAKGFGKVATSPGSYNKELLILEKKKDGKPMELHTDLEDLIKYFTPIRNAYFCFFLLFVFLFLVSVLGESSTPVYKVAMLFLLCILSLPSIKYTKIINKYKKEMKIYE